MGDPGMYDVLNGIKGARNLPLGTDYIKVMDLCLNAYNEEEIELILNTLVRMYLRYYKKRIVE